MTSLKNHYIFSNVVRKNKRSFNSDTKLGKITIILKENFRIENVPNRDPPLAFPKVSLNTNVTNEFVVLNDRPKNRFQTILIHFHLVTLFDLTLAFN